MINTVVLLVSIAVFTCLATSLIVMARAQLMPGRNERERSARLEAMSEAIGTLYPAVAFLLIGFGYVIASVLLG